MKRLTSVALIVLFALLLFGASTTTAQKKMKAEAVMMPTESMKWEEMKGGPPGVTYCNVWGDMGKGAYGAFIKLPPNLNNPLHSHSNDTKVVVVAGSFYMADESGKQTVMGPGSYFMEPGWMKHTSGTKEQGATLFQQSTGKFDFNMAETPKEKK